MENNNLINLNASYVFYSVNTKTYYLLNVSTGPLTNPFKSINPNCKGYTIINGTLTVISNKANNQYNVPGGQTVFLYNALWSSASDSPDGTGSPWCNGIDRLYISFSTQNNNTMIVANSNNSITIVNGTPIDTAILVHSIFPPTP